MSTFRRMKIGLKILVLTTLVISAGIGAFCLSIHILPRLLAALKASGISLDLDGLLSLLGMIITLIAASAAIISYVLTTKKDRHTKRAEIYQALEFSAQDLMQLGIEERDLIYKFNSQDPISEELSAADAFAAEEYYHKTLTLMEMATKFRIEGISHPSIYATWVAWIYELCGTPLFVKMWDEEHLGAHYHKCLVGIIEEGIVLRGVSRKTVPVTTSSKEVENERKFYLHVATMLDEIRKPEACKRWWKLSPVMESYERTHKDQAGE